MNKSINEMKKAGETLKDEFGKKVFHIFKMVVKDEESGEKTILQFFIDIDPSKLNDQPSLSDFIEYIQTDDSGEYMLDDRAYTVATPVNEEQIKNRGEDFNKRFLAKVGSLPKLTED